MYHLLYQPPICFACLSKLEIVDITTIKANKPTRILYRYNDFFKQLLFQYKGQYDLALKDVFLCTSKEDLQRRYQDYLIVTIPSSKEDNEKRGFCPNEEIVKTFTNDIFRGLYKSENYKQTNQKDRRGIKKILQIKDGYLLTKRKVLIFDDVVTSGNTLQATVDLLQSYHPTCIEILVLASKQIPT